MHRADENLFSIFSLILVARALKAAR